MQCRPGFPAPPGPVGESPPVRRGRFSGNLRLHGDGCREGLRCAGVLSRRRWPGARVRRRCVGMNEAAATKLVDVDTSILTELSPLGEAKLGDVLKLPDGRSLTVRAVAAFPSPVLTMGGFVILGECEVLVSAPSRRTVPHVVYLPLAELPAAARTAKVTVEGVLSYWAPHLPSMQGAMGELPFRVLEVSGSPDPWVVVYRGPELVVFVPGPQLNGSQLHVLRMPRRHGDDGFEVVRHVAIVEPVATPTPAPAPQRTPVAVPAR